MLGMPLWVYLLIAFAVVWMIYAIHMLWLVLCYEPKKPEQPGPINAILKEEPMAGILVYDVGLPPIAEGSDTASRELTLTVGDGQPEVIPLGADPTVRIRVPQDSAVVLSLVNIDDGGNRSEPSTQSFTALDTIPPEAPGPFGEIKLVAEE